MRKFFLKFIVSIRGTKVKKDVFILLLILIPNLFLRSYRIDYAEGKAIFDEKAYYLEAARSYLQNRDDPNMEHPPLGKMFIAAGIKVLGDNPYGWRVPSLIFSIIGIGLIYILAKELFGGLFIPTMATLLLSLDNMYFIYSRLAVMEMTLLVFMLATIIFLWRYYKNGKFINLLLLAIFFGLSFSTKWTAALILPAIAVVTYRRGGRKNLTIGLITTLLATSIIYIISYLPYILRHSSWQFLALQQTIVLFWGKFGQKTQYSIASYFLNHVTSWLFNPGWDYDLRLVDKNKIGVINAMFNPVIYWVSIYFVVKSVREMRKALDLRTFLLVSLILLNFVPWFFVKRIQYLYYLLPILPYLYLLTAFYLREIYLNSKDGKYKTVWFVATAAAVFFFFYPMSSSLPVSKRYLSPLSSAPLMITLGEDENKQVVTLR